MTKIETVTARLRSLQNINEIITFSNGCLGSHNDEERSEMRYVMRHANPVSHQNFERNLLFLRKNVCWSVCSSPPPNTCVLQCRRPRRYVGDLVSPDEQSSAPRDDPNNHRTSFLVLIAPGRRDVKFMKRVGTGSAL